MFSEYRSGNQYDTRIRKANTNLYVKNFDSDLSEGDLCRMFESYGRITSCEIARDDYDRSKGFGFVNFKEPSMAEKAIEALHNTVLDSGKTLYVGYHEKKAVREKSLGPIYRSRDDRNLFVSNLDKSIDDESLKCAFARFGTVTSAIVMRDNGHSKGYGYVCFDTVDQAFTALNRMNRQILASKPINVDLFKRQENRSHTVDRSHAPKPKPVDPSNHATAFPRLNTRLSLFDSQFPTRLPPSTRSRKH